MKKKIFYSFLGLPIILVAWNFDLLRYGFAQASGQLSIIWNTRPVEVVLQDPVVSDSIKQKILLINEIKQFAFDSLGIHRNENYTTYYEQGGKPILWVVTACPPYEMKAYEWSFPILGNVSYKGYFVYDKALEEELRFKEMGFDTDVGEVSAWSTLGWLKDPILSSMLKRKPGSLANLIIHELTHGTLYIKDNVEFNENLASFIGDIGARKFLVQKYGQSSKEYVEYEKGLISAKEYSEHALHWAKTLDSLYKSFDANTSLIQKQEAKSKMIEQAKIDLIKVLSKNNALSNRHKKEFDKINNTYFLDYVTYRSQQEVFKEEFQKSFNSDFPSYMNYLKKKYPSL